MPEVTSSDAIGTLKDRHRVVWNAGDYDAIGRLVTEIGDRCAEAADIRPGLEVLDVATGTGNTAIAIARRGGRVTGLDLASGLIDIARPRAAAEGLEIEFMVGDAEELPFPDDSYDRVTSSIGVQFAPRHEVVAAELSRVLKPGGRIALCNWGRDSFIGRLFGLIGEYSPPPPPEASPPGKWGDEAHVRALFAPHGVELEFEPARCVMGFDTAEEYVELFEREYGPSVMLKAALETKGMYAGYRERWLDLAREFAATPGRGDLVKDYLVITGTKQ